MIMHPAYHQTRGNRPNRTLSAQEDVIWNELGGVLESVETPDLSNFTAKEPAEFRLAPFHDHAGTMNFSAGENIMRVELPERWISYSGTSEDEHEKSRLSNKAFKLSDKHGLESRDKKRTLQRRERKSGSKLDPGSPNSFLNEKPKGKAGKRKRNLERFSKKNRKDIRKSKN
mmetsp:Transcript_10414/g.14447  ORF Transcript_10414/g.14447 Transcript_10414/m.14447 type:complete len:172 (+) Transcript_10414:323-838(+)